MFFDSSGIPLTLERKQELRSELRKVETVIDAASTALPVKRLALGVGLAKKVSGGKKLINNLPEPSSIKLSKKAENSIRNIKEYRNMTTADAIRARGGNASNVREVPSAYQQKTVAQVAQDAANGDKQAVTALKIIKQANKKGQRKYND